MLFSAYIAVEDEAASSMYHRLEWEWLIYNKLLAYIEMVFDSDWGGNLKVVVDRR